MTTQQTNNARKTCLGLCSRVCAMRKTRKANFGFSPSSLGVGVPARLLEAVVAQPNRSTCDMKFIVHIWDAFTRWCQTQFDAKKGVKFLGLGEFTMRCR